MAASEALKPVAKAIIESKRLVVLTGAGMSKESGIPTFRDAQEGLWAKYEVGELATPQAFRKNPKLVWDWYVYRRDLVEQCQPNPGHQVLAKLDDLLPHCVVITQNIDGFHKQAGSSDVIELHGNIHRYKCSDNCRGVPTLVPVSDYRAYADESTPPPCPHCGAYLRPDIVWFNETLPPDSFERAIELVQSCDVLLIIGTSGVVMPAAALPSQASNAGATVIDINPQQDEFFPLVDMFVQGPSGVVLPRLLETIHAL